MLENAQRLFAVRNHSYSLSSTGLKCLIVFFHKIAGEQALGERHGSDPNVSSPKCDGCFVLCFIAKNLPEYVKISIIVRR